MIAEDVEEVINKGLELLDHKKGMSTFDLETKASTLLVLTANLSAVKFELEQQKVKALSTERASSARSMSKSTGKTVTEKKLEAETDPEYVNSREELETLENEISYIKAMIDVFNNGHIFYRHVMKETF